MATSPIRTTNKPVSMSPPGRPLDEQQIVARKRGVRRTVLLFALIAMAVYAGFILTGVLGHGAPR